MGGCDDHLLSKANHAALVVGYDGVGDDGGGNIKSGLVGIKHPGRCLRKLPDDWGLIIIMKCLNNIGKCKRIGPSLPFRAFLPLVVCTQEVAC